MATNIMIRSGTTFGLVNFAGNLPGFLTPVLNSALIKVIFTHNCCRLNSAYRMIIVCKTGYMSIMPNDPTRLYIWPHDQGHDHDHEQLSTAWGHFWWILAGQVNHVYGMVDGQLLSYKRLMFIWWSSYLTTGPRWFWLSLRHVRSWHGDLCIVCSWWSPALQLCHFQPRY